MKAATDIPSKAEFDELIHLCRRGLRDELSETDNLDLTPASVEELAREIFARRAHRWAIAANSRAGKWFLGQEEFLKASDLFWRAVRKARGLTSEEGGSYEIQRRDFASRLAERVMGLVKTSASTLRAKVHAELPSLPAKATEHIDGLYTARAELRREVGSDWLSFERYIAFAFREYFWDDADRELREVVAIKQARQSLSELRQIVEGPYKDACPPGIEGLQSNYRLISSKLISIQRELLDQHNSKLPKMRNDRALPGRLLLWNLRNGLRHVRRSQSDHAATLTELMHIFGVQGTWDRRTVDKWLKEWRERAARPGSNTSVSRE